MDMVTPSKTKCLEIEGVPQQRASAHLPERVNGERRLNKGQGFVYFSLLRGLRGVCVDVSLGAWPNLRLCVARVGQANDGCPGAERS